ncbi:hypothetical protein [Agrobacterium cavarae]|uniref:hypothetical protein n=1 Tax=Agrobacterium cavarae TaxID=2528239 RepID=UPI0028AD4089|nr:hypothetical protein [Agrobacterium cavarae]
MESKIYYRYQAFGLTLDSQLKMSHFKTSPVSSNPADIVISYGHISRELPTAQNGGTHFEFGRSEQHLDWLQVGKFDIRGDSEIVVDPVVGVEDELVCLPLLGPVMAVLLHIRGVFVLHASAVSLDGNLVAFLGDKMAGKSSTAAAFLKHDFRLVSDDLVPIVKREAGLVVLPTYPQMKLSSAAAENAGSTSITPLTNATLPGSDKRIHRVDDKTFDRGESVVKALYVLRRADRAYITEVNEATAFHMMMRYSFLARFGNQGLRALAPEQFVADCAQIVRSKAVHYLDVPSSLHRLHEVVSLVKGRL